MKVLVTGGLGFQGSNLSKALLGQGDKVAILNTLSERSQENIRRFQLQEANIVWGSITDEEVVNKSIREHDLVFHLAANIHVEDSLLNARQYYETNILGTLNVVEACRRFNIPMIYVSSCEVYGGCNHCNESLDRVDGFPMVCGRIIKESCPFKPQSPYAASKAGADSLVFAHSLSFGQKVFILRPFNVFGPGQRCGARGAVIPKFVYKALNHQDILIYGDGRQKRTFVYIDDLIRVYLFLINKFMGQGLDYIPQKVLNIGTKDSISILEVAKTILKVTNSKGEIKHIKSRPGEVKSFKTNSTELKLLGFKFRYDFKEGIKEYVKWFKQLEY